MPKAMCSRHPKTALLCPRCIAARGGRRTAALHRKKHKVWGKLGGRRKAELYGKKSRARQDSNL